MTWNTHGTVIRPVRVPSRTAPAETCHRPEPTRVDERLLTAGYKPTQVDLALITAINALPISSISKAEAACVIRQRITGFRVSDPRDIAIIRRIAVEHRVKMPCDS
jgi:hypothetical protein